MFSASGAGVISGALDVALDDVVFSAYGGAVEGTLDVALDGVVFSAFGLLSSGGDQIALIGTAAAEGASVALPAHVGGDCIVVFAFRSTSSTSPALPTGWTNIINGGGSGISVRMGYRFADDAQTQSGTWTGATQVHAWVLRNVSEGTTVGVAATQGGNGPELRWGASTLQVTDGSSWMVCGGGHVTATNLNQAPSGLLLRNAVNVPPSSVGLDTGVGVSEWPLTIMDVNTSGNWRTVRAEIRAGPQLRFGSLAVTLDDAVFAASGDVTGTAGEIGTLDVVLADVVFSAGGTVSGEESRSGDLLVTLGDVVFAAMGEVSGMPAVVGQLEVMLSPLSMVLIANVEFFAYATAVLTVEPVASAVLTVEMIM